MDAIDMLKKQHRELEAAFEAVKGADASARHGLFVKAADMLMSHVLIEERLFYPAVNAKRTEHVLLESLEEHLSLKRVLSDLIALRVESPAFEPKVHVLAEQAEHHHEEEEEKLFPKVKKLLSSEELELLGQQMREAQTELLTKQPRTVAAQQTDEAAALDKTS